MRRRGERENEEKRGKIRENEREEEVGKLRRRGEKRKNVDTSVLYNQ